MRRIVKERGREGYRGREDENPRERKTSMEGESGGRDINVMKGREG